MATVAGLLAAATLAGCAGTNTPNADDATADTGAGDGRADGGGGDVSELGDSGAIDASDDGGDDAGGDAQADGGADDGGAGDGGVGDGGAGDGGAGDGGVGDDPVFVGAGDIARCELRSDEATAALIERIPGTVFTLGDNVYPDGTAGQFRDCYQPSWGRFLARTRPAPGNHDYNTAGAAGYYAYYGASAGDPRRGYYSYNLGSWHIVVINSNCSAIGGCRAGSPQERWLRSDLMANPARCTLAYWHHPRFSSGQHGNATFMTDIWRALYEAGADVVLQGHDHNYERFAPQDHTGRRDDARGVVSFVVGTGGTSLRPMATTRPNSEVRNATTHGVLRMVLHPSSYDWEFIPVAGRTFRDSGRGDCH